MEVPSPCEAAGPCPEGFLVRAVISVPANYLAPAGRAGSARGGPPSETPAHPERHEMVWEGREAGKAEPQTLPGVCTDRHAGWVCVCTQRRGHTRACTHGTYPNMRTGAFTRIHNPVETKHSHKYPHTTEAHTDGRTYRYTHTHVYTHACSRTRTPCLAHQHVCPSASTALPALYGVGLGATDPATRPQAFGELKASPLLPLLGRAAILESMDELQPCQPGWGELDPPVTPSVPPPCVPQPGAVAVPRVGTALGSPPPFRARRRARCCPVPTAALKAAN